MECRMESPVMKFALPSGPATMGPFTGDRPSNVQRTVPPKVCSDETSGGDAGAEALGVAVGVAVGVRVGHGGHCAAGVVTETVTGCALIPPELTLIQAHPWLRPVYRPPSPVDGASSTGGPPAGLLFAVHSVLTALVMSA